jgi:hypothetical protein
LLVNNSRLDNGSEGERGGGVLQGEELIVELLGEIMVPKRELALTQREENLQVERVVLPQGMT